MAKQCTICGKKSIMAWKLTKLRGKYNPTAKRRKYPNLQWVKLPASPARLAAKRAGRLSGKRVLACAKCIKAIGKRK